MSTLAIMLLTAHRLSYAQTTLRSILENIKWSGDLDVHIASDGDDSDYIGALQRIIGTTAVPVTAVRAISTSNSKGRGYGANYNQATQMVHETADYVLPLEDDWECLRRLDADRYCAALDALGGGCIRLGYIGYTQSLRGEFAYTDGAHYLRLDETSPEPHVFAGHPRIETKAWERFVGPWPEDMTPGETEFQIAHNVNARKYVYWPVDLVRPSGDLFGHIGTERSY